MATFSQAGRPLAVTTPLGTDKLLLEKFTGEEGASSLFNFQLELFALADSPVDFSAIIGKSVTVTLKLSDDTTRYLNGIVSRFSQGPQVQSPLGANTLTRYRAEIVPKLWLLTHKANSRIFQQMSVPDILKKVLTGLDATYELQGTYEPRDYCTQYRETDFAFLSRLMEEEGIYYFFRHSDGAHTLVLADTPQSHADVPGPATIKYEPVVGGARPDMRILSWEKHQEIRSGKQTLWDHCFELPGQNLEATQTILSSVALGTVTHSLTVGPNDALERYDYPGAYAQRFDGIAPGGGESASDVQKIFQDNARTTGIRMQQEAVPSLLAQGVSNCAQLTSGFKFTLQNHFDANGSYVLTRVRHSADLGGAYTTQESDFAYHNEFECIPAALPLRPLQRTPRARVYGTQTAVVVGPSGEEIFTDKYSRVKVQFPWDRDGKKDASSSCWVRVGSFWAGKQWGAIHIPRIGQEVIVAFEEGDPDRPIIVGSVYNAEQMPPYTLPDNKTQSGIKSRSSKQGTAENFNELRFEDKKDSEQIYFHAEKNFDRVVENNDTLKVGFEKKDKGDQTIEIFNNQTLTVGAGKGDTADGSQTISVYKDRTETVETGNETITIKKGNRTETVETGNESITIKKGNRTVTVETGNDTHTIKTGNREVSIDTGNDTLTIKTGNQTIKLNAGASATEAMQSIELKVGGNSIKIDQSGITIKGMVIKVQGQVQVQVQAPMTQVNGDGMLQLKGGVTMIN